jgi:hypothetical protein
MALDKVAESAHLFVKVRAALNAYSLVGGNTNTGDVPVIPDFIKKWVCGAER